MFKLKPQLMTDSYKLGHADQYPDGTTLICSNFTARSNKNFKVPSGYETNKIVFFGLQATIREMHELWDEEFFQKDFNDIAEEFLEEVAPFVGDKGFNIDRLQALHELGYLPINIKALPEGSRVNIGVPVFVIWNTKEDFYWLTNFLETYLSTESWKSITIATIADRYRAIFEDYAEKTGADKRFIDIQGHDFSMRGMSGSMDGVKNSSAHALSFIGSDNVHCPSYLKYYYYTRNESPIFQSVSATEHSVMCAGGETDEKETIRRIIQDIYPTGIVSIVSDSWDFWNVITNTAYELKDVILNRGVDSHGLSKVVFRPDSGDPFRIICGYKVKEIESLDEIESRYAAWNGVFTDSHFVDGKEGEFGYDAVLYQEKYYSLEMVSNYDDCWHYKLGKELTETEVKGAAQCLWDIFGGTTNEKGFKTINQRVGLIYGDSITMQRAVDILEGLKLKGFASDNIVFGIGSFTYQHITRDTFGFAMKATYAVINGKEVNIFKNPKTDSGTKRSAKGLLRVEKEGDDFVLYDQQSQHDFDRGALALVFDEGGRFGEELESIRERLRGE